MKCLINQTVYFYKSAEPKLNFHLKLQLKQWIQTHRITSQSSLSFQPRLSSDSRNSLRKRAHTVNHSDRCQSKMIVLVEYIVLH